MEFKRQPLTDKQFVLLAEFIQNHLGIRMPDVKRVMLESRLHKRLKDLKMSDFQDYCDYLFSKEGQVSEINKLFNVVTTNKTDFFREPGHYDYMKEHMLGLLLRQGETLRIWSAGCSSGEEPYSIAIHLEEAKKHFGDFNYSILGSDISTDVLHTADEAVYSGERVKDVNYEWKKRYFLKSKDESTELVRLKPFIRSKVEFAVLNLMNRDYSPMGHFDIIFCRNVLIYFDRDNQRSIVARLVQQLKQAGFLILGHSETLAGQNSGLVSIAPTVYQKG